MICSVDNLTCFVWENRELITVFQHVKDFEDLVRTIVTLCNTEEQERLREMEDWIVKNEGTWVLSEGFNVFLHNVFHR